MYVQYMESISIPVQNLLDLFVTDLSEIRFGDIDAETLKRLAADVDAAAVIVSSAQAALESAQGMLVAKQDALLQQAQRAAAYARVYAENDEALTLRLNAIALPRTSRRARQSGDALVLCPDPEPAPRPRARSRKVVTPDASHLDSESLLAAR
jgi:hypothetical protein